MLKVTLCSWQLHGVYHTRPRSSIEGRDATTTASADGPELAVPLGLDRSGSLRLFAVLDVFSGSILGVGLSEGLSVRAIESCVLCVTHVSKRLVAHDCCIPGRL